MLIRSLHLRNIRSYTDETVEFPEGSTLLAGDIGSGKSTILLALEFALFGIQRGELSGSVLLRHGSRTGSVTLTMHIAEKELTITRGLKRTDTGVAQETGTLTIDGNTTELTAQELKSRILELLNYPPSLLKGKGPLFRYTVYTPQEEMKAILYESPDTRLETLRKLFDIDKYKRVRENTLLLLRELRRQETELRARIEELGKDMRDEAKTAQELSRARQDLTEKETLMTKAQQLLKQRRTTLDEIEHQRFRIEELKKQLAIGTTRIEGVKMRLTELAQERSLVEQQIAESEKHLSPSDADEQALRTQSSILTDEANELREKERALMKREAMTEAATAKAQGTINEIDALAECPTCKQPVTAEHKNHIHAEEERKILEAKEKRQKLMVLRQELERDFHTLDMKKKELDQKLSLIAVNKERLSSISRLKERLLFLGETAMKIRKQNEEMIIQTHNLESQLAQSKAVDEAEYHAAKHASEEANTQCTITSVKVAELRKDAQNLEKELLRITAKRKELEERERQLLLAQQRSAWLEKQIIHIAHAIERGLFSSIYGLFNACFRDWFATLMEDETITVRLDAEFSPVIIQNGYETSIEHLSGGEKTSVALAYRLALNKAVNDFLTTINTRDLLILDEPTDGFSSEQLDRVREVLDQLRLRQIIIVSHEAQMEGYVNHVIRVLKQDHESRVLT